MQLAVGGDSLPYATLSDEELLAKVYIDKDLRTAMELELAARLDHALQQLEQPPLGWGDVITRKQVVGVV
jgi:hypothetical protein